MKVKAVLHHRWVQALIVLVVWVVTATALKGDTSTDQQHDYDAPHRGGQQYPAAGSCR